MALAYVGSNSAQGESITIPAGHAAGDLLVVFAFRDGSTTAPSLPYGWTQVGLNTGTTCSSAVAYKWAGSANETSGTWSNASAIAVHVYRGAFRSGPPVINSGAQAGTTNTINYSGITTMVQPGTSWVARFAGSTSVDQTLENVPSGHTLRTNNTGATAEVAGFDTNGAVSSSTFAGVAVTGTAGNYITKTLEILADNSASGLQTKTNTLTGGAVTGNLASTDPGFQPKALMVWNGLQTSLGATSSAQWSLGAATSSLTEVAAGYNSLDAAASSDVVRMFNTARIMVNTTSGTATNNLVTDVASLDPTGFTLNWATLVTASPLYNYLAIGGQDIKEAKSGFFAANTTSGLQMVTNVGFKPDIVILFANIQTSSATANANTCYSFGAATSSTERFATSVSAQQNVATTNNRRAFYTSLCFFHPQAGADSIEAAADMVSMDAGGFTIDWIDPPGQADLIGYLAIRGGNWKVGIDTQKTSTGTKATTGLGFTPSGLILATSCDDIGETINPHARICVGASTGPSNNTALWNGDTDNVPDAIANTITSNTKCLVMATEGTSATPTVNAEAELDSFDADGFTLDWTTADATERLFGYIAYGADNSLDLEQTIVSTVTQSTDDATETSAGVMDLTSTTAAWAGNNHVGLRFSNVPLPQGADIIGAKVRFENLSAFTGTGLLNGNVFAEDVDNSSTFTSAASDISTRTRTTAARGSYPATSVWKDDGVDVTAAVQEVIDRAGWASGHALSLLFIGSGVAGNNITPYTWDYFTNLYKTELIITYNTPFVPGVTVSKNILTLGVG